MSEPKIDPILLSVFARAFIRTLTGPDEEVPSPTFTLVQVYEGFDCPIHHFDFFRLRDAGEVDEGSRGVAGGDLDFHAEPAGVAPDQVEASAVTVEGQHPSLDADALGDRSGLSPGCGADVEHALSGLGVEQVDGKLGGFVLDGEAAVEKGGIEGGIAAPTQHDSPAGQSARRGVGKALPQLFEQAIAVGAATVGPYGERRRGIRGGRQRRRLLRSEEVEPALRNPLG